ncbi:dihydropteroate synthase [Egibacter rhizosphaerae]|uniref:Dihydropteroate synthase n=1 Tax=Egibacter rhizosphaerae TaxID=1670831 RepID=A0A411YJE1_9ACTN|nr:dihydropteroate synthase [Egibacter rhizosphaerae]QBI21196.1 dihydropteroate synthase [Egibacter rhizosphaerae]
MRLGQHDLDLRRRVAVMAIVNRTPDSFFDRGRTFPLDTAVDEALAHVRAGADLIDVGGVKAGPGEPVTPEQEHERIVPFVEAVRERTDAPISVDTSRASVAAAALDAGAQLVNDVSGLVEPEIADIVAARPGTGLVVMHPGGPPRTRPFRPSYDPDCTTDVVRTCAALAQVARERGVDGQQLLVDPGHDFGKTTFQSLEVTRRLPELVTLGHPVLVSLSRKDFLGEAIGGLPPEQRLEASLACAALCAQLGARMVRVHDTTATVRALRATEAILGWQPPLSAMRGLD